MNRALAMRKEADQIAAIGEETPASTPSFAYRSGRCLYGRDSQPPASST